MRKADGPSTFNCGPCQYRQCNSLFTFFNLLDSIASFLFLLIHSHVHEHDQHIPPLNSFSAILPSPVLQDSDACVSRPRKLNWNAAVFHQLFISGSYQFLLSVATQNVQLKQLINCLHGEIELHACLIKEQYYVFIFFSI